MGVEVKKYKVTPAVRERWDGIIRKAAKAAGTNVEAALDKRYTSKPTVKDAKGKIVKYGYSAYERYLLVNGHTLSFSIDTETARVSSKPDKYAQAKVEKRVKRKATAVVKGTGAKMADLAVHELGGVSNASKKHNARKARKAAKVTVKPVVEEVHA
jgi:hypothetical protein